MKCIFKTLVSVNRVHIATFLPAGFASGSLDFLAVRAPCGVSARALGESLFFFNDFGYGGRSPALPY